MFAAIVILSVALYFSARTDNVQADNDLKYRYVKMKGEATPEQLVELENLFGPNRNNEWIKQMREDVEAYEEAVQRQATLTEQARLKEQAARELDTKAKSIKDKSNTAKPKTYAYGQCQSEIQTFHHRRKGRYRLLSDYPEPCNPSVKDGLPDIYG